VTYVGVTSLELTLADDEPALFLALTVNVYPVPGVNPVNKKGDAYAILAVPIEGVTVYSVMFAPPVLVGAVK
jgi:hypothetical protein